MYIYKDRIYLNDENATVSVIVPKDYYVAQSDSGNPADVTITSDPAFLEYNPSVEHWHIGLTLFDNFITEDMWPAFIREYCEDAFGCPVNYEKSRFLGMPVIWFTREHNPVTKDWKKYCIEVFFLLPNNRQLRLMFRQFSNGNIDKNAAKTVLSSEMVQSVLKSIRVED